jgi:hypothetical protein
MTDNLKLWNEAFVTDPAAVKAITGKQYKGNSPKPYWLIQRATEIFGACGIGWGVEVVNERFERFSDTESLHIALVRVWYVWDGKKGVVEQMGQTRSSYMSNASKFIVDEDAPKKSVTDGMTKCLSMLGFAGDIFSGRWDDSKYVEEAAIITEERTAPKVSAEQLANLNALANELAIDVAKFCAAVSVKSLADIKADDYGKAITLMEKKRK